MGAGIIYSIMGNIYCSFRDIFKKASDVAKSNADVTGDIDSQFFEKVMEEIESGYKDKGLEGKALALSEGDTVKTNALYLKTRAEALQKSFETQKEINRVKNVNRKKRKESARKFENGLILTIGSFITFLTVLSISMGISEALFGGNNEIVFSLAILLSFVITISMVLFLKSN